MADIRLLIVADGDRINFGPAQTVSGLTTLGSDYFALSVLSTVLDNINNATIPTSPPITIPHIPSIQVSKAHRRGGVTPPPSGYPDTTVGLTIPGNYVFPANLRNDYDVIMLIGDEGYFNNDATTPDGTQISVAELQNLANFMENGGGLFAVGDHDGIGQFMCGLLPRVRTMRKWAQWNKPYKDPNSGVYFMTNWSSDGGLSDIETPDMQSPPAAVPIGNKTDRFDTLQPDSTDNLYYFYSQSDANPQFLRDKSGTQLNLTNAPVHSMLRDQLGSVIYQFPDHMHEGEATDFTTISSTPTPFDPNDASGTPLNYSVQGVSLATPEFPKVAGDPTEFQPTPEVIAYAGAADHVTQGYPETSAKNRGAISVYDGRSVGKGRIVTDSSFHHYLDKNLIGDPGTETPNPPPGPSNSNNGFNQLMAQPVLAGIVQYYVNMVTWLAPANPNFYFVMKKSSFSSDEMQTAPASGFPGAFYLALDGFPPSVAPQSIALSDFSGAFANVATLVPHATSANGSTAQRIFYPVDVQSIAASAFPSAGAAPKLLTLEARISLSGGQSFFAEGDFELIAGENPYFQNVDPSNPGNWYLSQDLHVFRVTPGYPGNVDPFQTFGGDPYGYIASVLQYLNDPANDYTSGKDPFSQLSALGQLTDATSVDPHRNLTVGFSTQSFSNYNFALARVRLRGNTAISAPLRVFFRLFVSQTNDTDYDPSSTYQSSLDSQGLPTPLALQDVVYPFFATSGGAGSDYGPNQTSSIPAPPAGGETWAYFGCFLDVLSDQSKFKGTHHCLVAQIAYAGAPIIGSNGLTLSPENSDKLAQRNLQVTFSGNPGGPEAHRIPQTFDLRPSQRQSAPANSLLGYPDELMIDWGSVPRGSKASIYWPQVLAADVVRLATLLYTDEVWIAIDAHTVQCEVDLPITYVPIPFGGGTNFAGLFTIDLPMGVRRGQEFQVVVRRISTRQAPAAAPIAIQSRLAARGHVNTDWRYVVGTFQVTIPVSTEDVLVEPEENTLAIMKWRLQLTPPSNRWYPVLLRYVACLSSRVNAFGGVAGSVASSPTGLPSTVSPPATSEPNVVQHSGKVCEVKYDCFGDFEGFVLENCSGSFCFASREKAVGELALRACNERLKISIFADRNPPHKIRQIILRC